MAHCSVLEAHQKPTDRPSKRIKRSGGHSLVRRGLADWVVENVLLIMRAQRVEQPYANSAFTCSNTTPNSARSCYIPKKLPSHKAPGTRAIGPVVEQTGEGRMRIVLANMIAAADVREVRA